MVEHAAGAERLLHAVPAWARSARARVGIVADADHGQPAHSRSELRAAKHEMPERDYAQEFEARFLQLEGAGVFRGVGAVARLKPAGPQRGAQYVIGVDWARTNDFTAISVIDAARSSR